MNEIDKLKIEHARYKKALVRIQKEYGDESDACIYASAALNAPPPATLESLQTVAKYHAGTIEFFGDGSVVWRTRCGDIRSFANVEHLIEFLNNSPT